MVSEVIASVKTDLAVLKWMVGFLIAVNLAVALKALF